MNELNALYERAVEELRIANSLGDSELRGEMLANLNRVRAALYRARKGL